MNERLRDYGFSGAMYMILLHIERHPGTTQDSIANHMFIDKCNVARRTKKLEALGYLYRETNQNDRRQNNLYLTEKGRELVPVIRSYMAQWGRTITEDLTSQECVTPVSYTHLDVYKRQPLGGVVLAGVYPAFFQVDGKLRGDPVFLGGTS